MAFPIFEDRNIRCCLLAIKEDFDFAVDLDIHLFILAFLIFRADRENS